MPAFAPALLRKIARSRLGLRLSRCCLRRDDRSPSRRPPSRVIRPSLTTTIVYLTKDYNEPPPLSLVDKEVKDKGIQGARIALEEDNRTGRLLGQHYDLLEALLPPDGNPVDKAKELLGSGSRRHRCRPRGGRPARRRRPARGRDALIFDVRTSDDALRQEQCRANVFHIAPNWAMRADALAQYLLWKKWRHWVLIVGKSPADQGYAAAIRRAASRFGAKIVEERPYTFDAGSAPHRHRPSADPDADADADAGRPRPRRGHRRRRVRRLRRLSPVPHRRAAPRRRHARPRRRRLASLLRGVRRHADAEPLREADGPHHDRARLHRLARRAHHRRGGDAHLAEQSRCAARLHPVRKFGSPASRARA